MMRMSILACVLCAVLSGCATTTYIPESLGQTFPPYEGEITILTEIPASGYIRIGSISGEGGLIHSDSSLIAAIKRRARKVGADTIVLLGDSGWDGVRILQLRAAKIQRALLLRRR